MKFPLVTYAGVQFRLLLFRPNWEVPPTVNHRLDTLVGEGRTTIEERRPGRDAWLLDVALRLTLEGTEADDWRKGLAALGPGRVALPLWPALRPVAAWGARLYDPQHVINLDPWTGAYALHAADALPAEPAYSHYAPLLLGRFRRRPPAVPATESMADVDLEIAEASPYAWRIGVHAYGDGALPAPDRAEPVQDASDYGLEQIQHSAARELALDRTGAAHRWRQEAAFTFATSEAIRAALTLFAAKRGAWGTFPLPAWFQPGAPTPATPDTYTARFAGDSLALRFRTPGLAEARLAFVAEVATPGRDQALAAEAYLYQLAYDHDPANPERWTDRDAPLAVAGDGTYAPAQIAHTEIVRSLKPQDDRAEIRLAYAAGSLAADWLLARLYGLVRLTVWRCDPADAAGTRGDPLFTGLLQDVRPEGNTLVLTASLFGRMLDRRTPGWVFGARCNTWLFSPLCGLAEEEFASAGTAAPADVSPDGLALTVHGAAGWGGPAYPANHFAFGRLRTGAGRAFMEATIVASEAAGADLVLRLNRRLWPDLLAPAGQAVTLLPGCGGQWVADCGERYANQARFRGFPHVPEYIEMRSLGAPTAPKK